MKPVTSGKSRKRSKAAVFIDRDGTINIDTNYVNHPDQLELIPGAAEGIALLNQAGILTVVASNQSGVARGYLTLRTLGQIHRKLRLLLKKQSARLDAIYYCPYHPEQNHPCRKPDTGMALKAVKDLGIDPSCSYMVGDNRSDMEFARNIGAKKVLVLTGKSDGREPWVRELKVDCVAHDLLGATIWILKDLGKER